MELVNNDNYFVYILADRFNAIFQISVTMDIEARLRALQSECVHPCRYLVHYEGFATPLAAFKREEHLNSYSVPRLMKMIRQYNPRLADCTGDLIT